MSVVKITTISAPPQAGPELERRFTERSQDMRDTPGFGGFQLLRPVGGENRYFVVTQWTDEDSYWLGAGAVTRV